MMFVIIQLILVILLRIFTHGFMELRSKFSGRPIAMFFQDSKYMEWRAIKPEAGLIEDKDYGTFIINESGSYVDRRTKNVFLPFDAGLGSGASVKAFKITDDLFKVIGDQKKMGIIRKHVMEGTLDDVEMEGLRESINFSHLKTVMTAILPHNITSKIEKMVASRLSGFGKLNVPQVILIVLAVIGSTTIAIILLKSYGG
jgi:hypothetical protein